jgi:acetyl esterase/lipase
MRLSAPIWEFIGNLTRKARVRCVVPIYPLAPGGTAREVVPAIGNLLVNLLKKAGHAKVTVVGSSAGAGLGLSAAQWLRDNGYRQPNKLVLISPDGGAEKKKLQRFAN